jgi:hypothetical protein
MQIELASSASKSGGTAPNIQRTYAMIGDTVRVNLTLYLVVLHWQSYKPLEEEAMSDCDEGHFQKSRLLESRSV